MSVRAKTPCCGWDFTIAALESNELKDVKDYLNRIAKKWVFQLECGEESGYYHYQGRMSLKVKQRLPPYLQDARFSPTSKDTFAFGDDFYVTKPDTRIDGPWTNEDPEVCPQYQVDSLRPWQQSVLDSLALPPGRTINVIIDNVGNRGKSTLVGWLEIHGHATNLPWTGTYKDLMPVVLGSKNRKAFTLDIARAMRDHDTTEIYGALEHIKDGRAFDLRYAYRHVMFPTPHVWVFCNKPPKLELLSQDRWKFYNIVGDILVEVV